MSLCRHCGKPEEEHCVFEARKMPEGCTCEPRSWGDDITPICEKYKGDGNQYCLTCEHNAECHRPFSDVAVEKEEA